MAKWAIEQAVEQSGSGHCVKAGLQVRWPMHAAESIGMTVLTSNYRAPSRLELVDNLFLSIDGLNLGELSRRLFQYVIFRIALLRQKPCNRRSRSLLRDRFVGPFDAKSCVVLISSGAGTEGP